ncbi:MAG: phosphoribosyltransferase, partial [Candidatus Aenigmarchaeota archaeon]|nr:phosphoribosyltransferase [Candidatus Aenigmarchaeota archaeon]
FNEEIKIISEKVDELFDGIEKERRVVSGGQRRDWIFSGPVANKLDVPHVSLYKQKQGEEDKIEVIRNGSIDPSYSLKGKYAVHVVDLITKGSNIYRIENWQEMGWVSMLRKKGATINDLVAVVTRCQGGEKMLADLPEPVNVHSFVAIDEDFVKKYSNNPERVLEYMKDSMEWTKNYLKDNGALAIVDAFDPNGSKQNRAEKFIKKHCQLLYDAGKLDEFEDAIQEKYGISVMETYDLNKILR